MRWARAGLVPPAVLLLGGCGLGMGNYGDGGQLPPAPAAPAPADYGTPPGTEAPVDPGQALPYAAPPAAPGTSYAPPQSSPPAYAPASPASDTDAANTYRTADGVVHVIPRTSTPAASPTYAPRPAPQVRQPAAEAYQPAPTQAYDVPPPSGGPQGSSQDGGERYDAVGYAGVRSVASSGPTAMTAVVAVHPTLPAGAVVELTSLDTGRTILALVTATMAVAPGHVIDLSPGAARQLGVNSTAFGVRVRRVVASGGDLALLRAGQPAGDRIDAPAALLVGLRRRLGNGQQAQALPDAVPAQGNGAPPAQTYVAPVRQTTPVVHVARPAPAPAGQHGYFVQVAALSVPDRAQALARSLGGSVRPAGRLYKVQLGPYPSAEAAQRARAGVAARGYADAVIVSQ